MKVVGIKCPECGVVIYSRARHDYRECPCGCVAVDGGMDYLKVAGLFDFELVTNDECDDVLDFAVVVVDLDANRNELFLDWRYCLDNYGVVK